MKIELILLLAVIVAAVLAAKSSETCVTPSNEEGVCKSIHDCPFLKSLAIKEKISRKEIDYLRRSACGFNNSNPLVCCPEYGPEKCLPAAMPPDPWTGCCGRTATTYFNRRTYTAGIDQYPWMVIIEYDNIARGNLTQLLCSGVLISSRYLISNAICFKQSLLRHSYPKRVRLGEFDTTNPGPDCVVGAAGGSHCTAGALTVPIEQVTLHPGHDHRLRINNIALVRLSMMVPYTDFIRPICLPTMDLTLSPPTYFDLFIAGWGGSQVARFSDVLRHVQVPYVDLSTCQETYSKHGVALGSSHVCAGGKSGGDACKGDAGAPLMYLAEPFVEAVGLVDFGAWRCGQKIPSVYTKVFTYEKWIRETIKP